jgi:hypothetical protein
MTFLYISNEQAVDQKKNSGEGLVEMLKWYSTYLASMIPGVQIPILPKQRNCPKIPRDQCN